MLEFRLVSGDLEVEGAKRVLSSVYTPKICLRLKFRLHRQSNAAASNL